MSECPCGSKKAYVDCCYQIVLPNGKRKFHQGPSSFDGTKWTPIPGAFQVEIHDEIQDEHTIWADELLKGVVLEENAIYRLRVELYSYHEALSELKKVVAKIHGEGAGMSLTSPTLVNRWRTYLFVGRMLL